MPHTVNGGFFAGGTVKLAFGTGLELIFSVPEVLLTVFERPEQVLARFGIAALDEILVDGEIYKPQYVSFAKAPPQRDQTVDRNATSRLRLRFGGEILELEYRGAFARHLAEVAAHTLYDLRRLSPPREVAGQPPKVFHVVR